VILRAIRQGHTQRDAAALAGVDPSTLRRWLEKGAHPEGGRRYCAFRAAYGRAEAKYLQAALDRLEQEITNPEGDWRAAIKVLQAKRRAEWAPYQKDEAAARLEVQVKGKVRHGIDDADREALLDVMRLGQELRERCEKANLPPPLPGPVINQEPPDVYDPGEIDAVQPVRCPVPPPAAAVPALPPPLCRACQTLGPIPGCMCRRGRRGWPEVREGGCR
jgi:hypothetical protein